MTTFLTEKTRDEAIEAMIRNRTANFTPDLIAAWVSEQGHAAEAADVMSIIGVLIMKGVIRRESFTEWAVI